MTVTKEITRLEQSNVKLTLTIARDDVNSEYDALLTDYTKNVQIPGFRKGKVPREILIRKFGEALKGEALGRIMEKCIGEVFEDESFPREDRPLPYSNTQLQDEPPVLDLEKDLQFSVIYDVMPKITIGKWEGLEAEIPDVSVTEEDLSRELEAIRERNAIVLDRDEAEKAANNDVVTVNYSELGENGEVLAGTEREDFVFTLGSGYNIYKFDDEVLGMKKGESRDFEKTFPQDFEDKDLAGKTKKLKVTLTALKLKKLPDLDDDLAQDVDEKFKTLEDLKNNIRERLSGNLDQRLKEIKNNILLEKIMETTPAVIPESMVRLELDSRWRNLARRFNMDTQGLQKMMEQNSQDIQAILDGWRPDAVRALHSRLIVETLMEELKLEVSDEEVDREIENITTAGGESSANTAEEIKKYYQEEKVKDYLREDLKERKFFDILLEKSIIKAGKKTNYVDLMGNNG